MRLLAALLLSCILAMPAGAQSQLSGPSSLSAAQTELLARAHYEAWQIACAMKKAPCGSIKPPLVVYGVLDGNFGEYTDGERPVRIDVRLMFQPISVLVMIHEDIHYLQYVLGEVASYDSFAENHAQGCAREKEAFNLTWNANVLFGIVDPTKEPRLRNWDTVVTLDDGTKMTVEQGYRCEAQKERALGGARD